MSFHLITHAVCVAVIASLVRKYLHISYQYEELKILYQSCTNFVESKQPTGQRPNDEIYQFGMKENEEGIDGHSMDNFDNTKEMEYFNNLRSDRDYLSDGDVDEYTGTKFTARSEEKIILSKSESTNILPSTTVQQDSLTNDNAVEMDFNPFSEQRDNSTTNYTSVWCYGSTVNERICHFHNLCYHTKHHDFIFFQDKNSFFGNFKVNSTMINILDMSSVANHNLHHFSLTKLPSKSFGNFSISWIKRTSLIFKRFKIDNIMHVFHDDIFPLYHTLKGINLSVGNYGKDDHHNNLHNRFNVELVAMDGLEEDEQSEFLYSMLSNYKLLTKDMLEEMNEMVCFHSAYVGLSKSTTWYQYGFDRPQGPLYRNVTSLHIHQTVSYILSNIHADCQFCTPGQYLVLVSRKNNRRILNEVELSVAIAQKTELRVLSVDLETHSLDEIINIVSYSKGMIGMHGSLLVLSAFLQPGSILIELFPFAVNPLNYTPYKTLTQIPHMNIVYKYWINTDIKNTIMHPDNAPEFGGIKHLEHFREIMDQKEVPPHLCCDDPSWLFHIYQDTIVNVVEVVKLTQLSLDETKQKIDDFTTLPPGKVLGIECNIKNNTAVIHWIEPWNLRYLNQNSLSYELWFYHVQSNLTSSFILPNITTHSVDSLYNDQEYVVWLRCKLNHMFSPFSQAVPCATGANIV